ncbi:MAG: MXAN_2562 family outer membrane beta-barrel protein [Anaeromyxobacter sp.]
MKHLTLAALVAALLLPAAALAQSTHGEAGTYASPKAGSFELGMGKYLPAIDSEFNGSAQPYRDVFGTDGGWAFRAAVSWAVHASRIGVAEVGVKSGFFRDSGYGLDQSGNPTGDKTTFNVVPTSLIATYRFDGVPERLHVPLAPYLRFGLERYNWWVTDGDNNWSKEGATNGWSGTLGLALLLDWFDQQSARDLDREAGINHTYLFADWSFGKVDDFGSSKSWDLTNDKGAFQFGLMLAF